MKTARKIKGEGWDVFSVYGSTCNTLDADDYCEIQMVDCPEIDDEEGFEPCFKNDAAAVRYVIRRAMRGDAEAIDALWAAYLDDVVHQEMWQLYFKAGGK